MSDLDICLEVVSRSCQPLRCIQRRISWKPLEIKPWFQRTTDRKWHMGYQTVTWRHIGHVTPKVLWDSTVGYHSDSLTSCFLCYGVVFSLFAATLLRPQPTRRTSWQLVGIGNLQTSWKPGLPTRVATSFQLVRLVGWGLYLARIVAVASLAALIVESEILSYWARLKAHHRRTIWTDARFSCWTRPNDLTLWRPLLP